MKQCIKKVIVAGFFVCLSIFYILCIGINIVYAATENPAHFGNIQLYSSSSSIETISYTSRTTDLTETEKGVPFYQANSSLSNACGAIAGAIVLGFYDKYYENLIPDFTSYFTSSGKYKPADKTYIPALIDNLYVLMRTNVDDVGVAEDDCLNGLKKYIKDTGYDVAYTSVKSSSGIDQTAYLDSISNNKPVLVFAKKMEIVSGISSSSNTDTISKLSISDNHIFVGYGLYKINYLIGSSVRTDTYLKVACGLAGLNYGYIKISSTAMSVSSAWLVNAYSVSVV